MKNFLITIVLLATIMLGCIACTKDNPTYDTDKSNTTETASDTETSSEETTVENQTTELESTSTNVANPEESLSVLDNSKNYSILFIGNSYTYYNDMPEKIFARIMRSAGYRATIERITKGSQYLLDSANASDEVGAKVDKAFSAKKYDFVILQEQSTCPALNPGKFYDGVRALAEKARENGATPILYGTWGRNEGHSALKKNGWTNESMTWKIAAAYDAIGYELGIDVAHVGLSFFDVHTNNKDITIYNKDNTHPSPDGSYLAAMTIFAKITGVDPTTVSYQGNLEKKDSEILKEAARKAVFETPSIPDKYKTSSIDVKNDAK